MRVLLDAEGKVNYDGIAGAATVQELLDAIDEFLDRHRLPCDACGDSCC